LDSNWWKIGITLIALRTLAESLNGFIHDDEWEDLFPPEEVLQPTVMNINRDKLERNTITFFE
jgi:hypothetical protein